jgi:hypothetical protein
MLREEAEVKPDGWAWQSRMIVSSEMSCPLIFALQALAGEKENRAVLCLDLVGVRRQSLHDCGLFALVSPISNKDLFFYGKACHENLLGALAVVLPGAVND